MRTPAARPDARFPAAAGGAPRAVRRLAAAALVGLAARPARPAPDALPSVTANGQPYVRIADMARLYGLRVSSAADEQLVLSSLYHSMIFEAGNRRISLMDVQVWLQHPVSRLRGRWVVHRSDADFLLDPILRPYRFLRTRGATVIVLDAGHGGKDGGTESVVPGLVEKDLTLDIVRRVRACLPRGDLDVRLTRDDDVYLDLDERSRLASRWNPDVFISVHCNSGPDPMAEGIETYILSKAGAASTNTRDPSPSPAYRAQPGNAHDAASAVLGFALQKRMLRETGAPDRGLRHARFAVLKGAPCAAALVECGFLSNPMEAQKLASPDYRDRLALSIARGLLDYATAVRKAQLWLP